MVVCCDKGFLFISKIFDFPVPPYPLKEAKSLCKVSRLPASFNSGNSFSYGRGLQGLNTISRLFMYFSMIQ